METQAIGANKVSDFFLTESEACWVLSYDGPMHYNDPRTELEKAQDAEQERVDALIEQARQDAEYIADEDIEYDDEFPF